MEGHTLALKVIEVMFRSSEDASVTQNMWRNSCAVTHKHPTPSPAPPPPPAHHWLWRVLDCDLALPLPTLLRAGDSWRSIWDVRAAVEEGGGIWLHMIYAQTRVVHWCVPPSPPPCTHPPLTNTQTRAYINYPATCCYAYFWWLWGVACSYVIRQRRLV